LPGNFLVEPTERFTAASVASTKGASVMHLPDPDNSVSYSFGLDVEGVMIKQIADVSGLKMEQDVIELKENSTDGQEVVKKLPGRPKSGEVTLTRGLTEDSSFEKWMKNSQAAVRRGVEARSSSELTIYDHSGNELKRYKLTNAWPKSLEIGALKAGDTNVLTEKLTISYEEIEPV
jgi:phage tail-like protein